MSTNSNINSNTHTHTNNGNDIESDDDDLLISKVVCTNVAVLLGGDFHAKKVDHRTLPRSSKAQWKHDEALHCIRRDYLGHPNDNQSPLLSAANFQLHFRVSRARFERLRSDVANGEMPFYKGGAAADGSTGASLEAKLLLPLKCLSHGVPPHCFQDYFQMSKTLAKACCDSFDDAVGSLHQKEYLRLPTKADLHAINNLHKAVHGVEGMFGSLDCMHTFWKNCPKAWQGNFQGKEGRPSIVLEAISDHHLWFWHASCGHAGTLNDLNILNLSPFLESLVDGSFAELEESVVPFEIDGERFGKMFVLTDGIYPPYSRFAKSIPVPVTKEEKAYAGFQEAARKDIERAFGVLQIKEQWMARPILLHKMNAIGSRVRTCLIIHNMNVSDRVMGGDVHATHKPDFSFEDKTNAEEDSPGDLGEIQARGGTRWKGTVTAVGVDNMLHQATALVTAKDRWQDLSDVGQHNSLVLALMRLKTKQEKKRKR